MSFEGTGLLAAGGSLQQERFYDNRYTDTTYQGAYQISRAVADKIRTFTRAHPSYPFKQQSLMNKIFRQMDVEDSFFQKYGISEYREPRSINHLSAAKNRQGAQVIGAWSKSLAKVIQANHVFFRVLPDNYCHGSSGGVIAARVTTYSAQSTDFAVLKTRELTAFMARSGSIRVDILVISQLGLQNITYMAEDYKKIKTIHSFASGFRKCACCVLSMVLCGGIALVIVIVVIKKFLHHLTPPDLYTPPPPPPSPAMSSN